MRKIIDIFTGLALALLLSSCAERMEETLVPLADRDIVIDFSAGKTKALVEDTEYESRIDHIDFFVFRKDNTLCWHERANVSSSEGSHTLSMGTGYFAQKDAYGNVVSHPEYSVYLLANCLSDMAFDAESGVLTMTSESGAVSQISNLYALGNSVQETLNIHMSGLNIPAAPSLFLMDAVAKIDGSATVQLSSDQKDRNIVLDATFVRAAAKVVINIREGNTIEFTEGAGLDDDSVFAETEHGLYYIRNLPFKTHFLSGYYQKDETDNDRLLTTTKTNNAHFTWRPLQFNTNTSAIKDQVSQNDVVTLTTYVYEHSWEGKSVFEFEPCAVVNLPLISLEQDGDEIHWHAHPNSWYKIPLTNGNEFTRNSLYKVNVVINYAGATTVMEPVVVPDIKYEVINYSDGNIGWIEQEIDISQADRPKYLMLNMDEVEMHNTSVNDIVEFTSSKEVTVSINSVYYYDKYGIVQYQVRPGSTSASSAAGIKVSAQSGLFGKIKVESPVPTNNAPRYIEIKVSNGEAEDQYFTVIQYPLEYITNIQGYYSYREDFGGTTYEAYQGSRYVAVGGWNQNTQSWSRYSSSVGSTNTYMFSSKFAKPKADGTSQILYYSWSKNGKLNEDASNLSSLKNGRMYHVKIASSSADYSAGIPKLNSKGWTDSGDDNKNLVSPSFMIASQLGATFAPTSMEMAASHCANYVETYYEDKNGNRKKDSDETVVHLKDWRLPTEAEIKIIIKFQYVENAAMDEVLSGRYYWSATGQVENTLSGSSSGSSSAVRCIRNAF